MLRLISVVGITIAMVIGFLAISSQMKDDYSVRSRVVSVLKQMKELASNELECAAKAPTPNTMTPGTKAPEVEIAFDVELEPLIGESTPETIDEEQSGVNTGDEKPEDPGPEEIQPENEETTTENITEFENADIIKTMGYRVIQPETVEVITIFKGVSGESGKLRIKSGSRIVINCNCVSDKMSCKTVESNINKNYLPKSLTKQ